MRDRTYGLIVFRLGLNVKRCGVQTNSISWGKSGVALRWNEFEITVFGK